VTKSIAGKVPALIAVSYLSVQNEGAFLFQEGALLISGPAAGAIRHRNALALQLVSVSKIGAAYRAVHSARTNQYFFHPYPIPGGTGMLRSILSIK
jgi:hypothetical protein